MELNLATLSEEELVLLSRQGNSAAEEILIRKYMPLARKRAKAYFITGADGDDVIQEGMIGIFKAIRNYDPEKGASLRTFVELCVNRQIITAIRSANKEGNRVLSDSLSLDEPDSAPILNETQAAPSGDPAEAAMLREKMQALEKEVRMLLSPMEYQVWGQLKQGLTYRQIADILKKEPKSVDNTIQRIRRKLKRIREE